MTTARIRTWITVGLLTASSILILALNQALRWSDPFQGFLNGLLSSVKVIPFLIGGAVAWLLLVAGLVNRLKHPLLRWLLISLPLLIGAAWIVHDQPNSREQFFRITGEKLPENIPSYQSRHQDGLLAAPRHTFSFRCTPDETTRFIKELGWEGPYPFVSPKPSMTGHDIDMDSWVGPSVYAIPSKGGWNFELVTDQDRERVFIVLSSN